MLILSLYTSQKRIGRLETIVVDHYFVWGYTFLIFFIQSDALQLIQRLKLGFISRIKSTGYL